MSTMLAEAYLDALFITLDKINRRTLLAEVSIGEIKPLARVVAIFSSEFPLLTHCQIKF